MSRPIEEYKVGLALLAIGNLLEVLLMHHHDGYLYLQLFGHCKQLNALRLSPEVQNLLKSTTYITLNVGRELLPVGLQVPVIKTPEVGYEEGIEEY